MRRMEKVNEFRNSFCMLIANLTIQLNASNDEHTQFQLKQSSAISDGSQEENFLMQSVSQSEHKISLFDEKFNSHRFK